MSDKIVGSNVSDLIREFVSQASVEDQRLFTYINPRIEKTLSQLYKSLLVIPLSILAVYVISVSAFLARDFSGIHIFYLLHPLAKIAPIAILLYYFLRLLYYLRKNRFGLPATDDADLPVPVPSTNRGFRISTRTVDAVSQGYLSICLGMIWVAAINYSQVEPGQTHIQRLQYIHDNNEWINSASPTVFNLIFPSPIAEASWEVAGLIGFLFFEFLIIRSIVIVIEQLVGNFRKDAKERIIAIAILHYHLMVGVFKQWRLTMKIGGVLLFNLLLYLFLLWTAALDLCLRMNQDGLAWLKCMGI